MGAASFIHKAALSLACSERGESAAYFVLAPDRLEEEALLCRDPLLLIRSKFSPQRAS